MPQMENPLIWKKLLHTHLDEIVFWRFGKNNNNKLDNNKMHIFKICCGKNVFENNYGSHDRVQRVQEGGDWDTFPFKSPQR